MSHIGLNSGPPAWKIKVLPTMLITIKYFLAYYKYNSYSICALHVMSYFGLRSVQKIIVDLQ